QHPDERPRQLAFRELRLGRQPPGQTDDPRIARGPALDRIDPVVHLETVTIRSAAPKVWPRRDSKAPEPRIPKTPEALMRASSRSPLAVLAVLLAACVPLACNSVDEPESASLQGQLAVYQSDFKNGSTALEYRLRRAGLPELKLELATPPRFA